MNDKTILPNDVLGMVDKRNILLLLGAYCKNPKLVLNPSYETSPSDYNEDFHRIIYGAIYNIAKKGNVDIITPMEIENELSQFENAMKIWKTNNGWDYIETAIETTEVANAAMYKDNIRKYSILREAATSPLKMDISFLYDENDEVKMNKFNNMTSKDVLASFNVMYDVFKNSWKSPFEDNTSFHMGDNIDSRIDEYLNQDTSYGYPFQSGFMTTVFRGMRPKKFTVLSSKSGGGKSRGRLAEACNIASDRIYDWDRHEWISTGEKQPVLFISTELMQDELQACLLAHISGIEEDVMTEGNLNEEQIRILRESAEVVKESLLFGEYMPDFTIDSIAETIEKYIINNGITHCFFDYINDSPSLYSYYAQKTGTRLQTHQILFLFSMELKKLCNRYGIYLGTSTQLSSNYKDEKDANAIKGSKSIIEKADGGIIALPATSSDMKKLKPILESGFFRTPNFAYYIYKNRGGKWNNIIIWTQINLGTVRELDCFVTDNDYNIIKTINPTEISFQVSSVGDVKLPEYDSEGSTNEFINEYKSVAIEE
ncbi:MAG: DnaB-like helicase C-terminal domain-containing protein [Clostridium butyricum]